MGITGSDKALMYALGGLARGGATRGGYISMKPFINLANVEVAHAPVTRGILIDSLSIVWTVNAPSTCTFTAIGFTPIVGQEVIIRFGSLNNPVRLFAGHLLTVEQTYLLDKPANVAYHCSAIDYTPLLNRRKVIARYTNQSASFIFADIVARNTSGFTTNHVAAGLPIIDEITFTNQDVTAAFTNLAKRIGENWTVDFNRDLHFPSADSSATAPTPLTPSHASLAHFSVTRDNSQRITRVYFEGGGVNASADVAIGETLLPIDDDSWYQSTGGVVVSGPQRLTYTGVVAGGSGSLVGTTVTPSNAPTVTKRATTGLSTGDYRWAVLFGTAAGRTLPSPLSALLTLGGVVDRPYQPPSVVRRFGGNLSVGLYRWKFAYLTAAGETLTSAESAGLTMEDVAAPTTIGTASLLSISGGLDASADYRYGYTFRNDADATIETLLSPASNTFTTLAGVNDRGGKLTKAGIQAPPLGFSRQFYRTVGGGSTYQRVLSFYNQDASYYYDDASDSALTSAAPATSTAKWRSADVTVTASIDPLVTNIRVYRTAANGSIFKKVADLANTSGTYTDTLADASLGSTELSTATALYFAADLSNIPIGPTGTTYREVYRTVANGAALKLQSTISNNTATTLTDTTADASLGAAPPVTDTSGLVSTAGEVAAGSTSILVTATGPFRSTGGWAFMGTLPIRYGGFSSTALTGVPASGVGSLATTVRYGTEIIAAPMLVGIPASGAGSIVYAITRGEPVNLLVQVDDLDAQAELAQLMGGDGVQEDYLQDRRISYTEALSRAETHLALRNQTDVSIRYDCRDMNTHVGGPVSVAMPAPTSVTGDFLIQRVTISGFNPQAQFAVEAAPSAFSLSDLLKLATKGSTAP